MDEPSGIFLFVFHQILMKLCSWSCSTQGYDIQQPGMDLGWLEQKILSGLYVLKINDCKFLVCQMSICFR